MRSRMIGQCILVLVSGLTLSEGVASSGELMPLDPVPDAYAKKIMPGGWWIDPKVIKEGRDIYFGDAHPLVACHSCHGQDGRPVNSGGGLRDQNNVSRFSDSPVRNPAGPETGKYKVLRGGSWDLAPENLRSAHRDFNVSSTADYDSPAYWNFNSGFRCAKSP